MDPDPAAPLDLGWPMPATAQLDMSVTALAPDAWLSCSDDCKMAWAREWVRECTG